MRRARAQMCLAGSVVIGLLAASSAQAQVSPDFRCRASAIRAPIIGEPFVANPQYAPCAAEDEAAVSDVGFGSDRPNQLTVRASALRATTVTDPVDPTTGRTAEGGAATAYVASAHINAFNVVTIDAVGLGSTAGRKCRFGQPDIGGSSVIAFLRINGRPFPVSAYNTRIPLLIGTLWINHVERSATDIQTRALWLDLAPAGDSPNDVVLAEARGGSANSPNPCAN